MFRVGRALLLNGRVAVTAPARPESAQSPAFKAAVRLGSDKLQKGVVDESHGAEGQARPSDVRGHAGRDVDNLHVRRGKIMKDELPGVSEIARQPRKVVDQPRNGPVPLARDAASSFCMSARSMCAPEIAASLYSATTWNPWAAA